MLHCASYSFFFSKFFFFLFFFSLSSSLCSSLSSCFFLFRFYLFCFSSWYERKSIFFAHLGDTPAKAQPRRFHHFNGQERRGLRLQGRSGSVTLLRTKLVLAMEVMGLAARRPARTMGEVRRRAGNMVEGGDVCLYFSSCGNRNVSFYIGSAALERPHKWAILFLCPSFFLCA